MEFVLKQEGSLDLELLSNSKKYLDLINLANGSPGKLMQNVNTWKSIPDQIVSRLEDLPANSYEALSLARDLTDALNGEQQLWLIDWLQIHLWNQKLDSKPLKRLEKLRSHLLGYVQPRLAWEVALLELLPDF